MEYFMQALSFLGLIGCYILVIIILIYFSNYISKAYSKKDPRKSNEERERIRNAVVKQEKRIYILTTLNNILFSVAELCMLKEEDSKNILFEIIVTIMLLASIISIIIRGFKQKIISNKLCTIVVVIVIGFYLSIPILEIFNQGSSSCIPSDTLQEFEIQAFNSKFNQYEGNKTGAQVRALIREIISSNSNQENESRIISVKFLDSKGNPWTEVSFNKTKLDGAEAIKAGRKYKVEFEYSDGENSSLQGGLIYECKISEISSK